MPNFISEDNIEQAVLQKLHEQHGFQLLNCYTADADNLNDRSNRTSIERVIDGLCAPAKLLDYIENFVIYYKETQKIIAQNHQYIGVNKAIEAFQNREAQQGKLGVFWHTQGSGKSFAMIFYVRKILRKLTGNFTFVVITDRDNLDSQIYRNFLHTATIKKTDVVQPKNSKEMRETLTKNKPIVFTLIQKFRYDKGEQYPVLSDRNDIIVIVDEAHRTQYKTLAEKMLQQNTTRTDFARRLQEIIDRYNSGGASTEKSTGARLV
jgi:type I restriction enzyme, R subunit